MKDSKIRCGVIGAGRMGRHHVRVYAQNQSAELVGVVDVDSDVCNSIVEEWGGKAYGTVEELLAAGVDAVTIATPTIHHRSAAETMFFSILELLIVLNVCTFVD